MANKKFDYTVEGQKTSAGTFVLTTSRFKNGQLSGYDLSLMGYSEACNIAYGDTEEEFAEQLDEIISYLQAVRQDIMGQQEPIPDSDIPF